MTAKLSPAALADFAGYCAPATLAALTGATRLEAAELLSSVPGMMHPKFGGVWGPRWQRWLVEEMGGAEVVLKDLPSVQAAYERYYQRRRDWYAGKRWDAPCPSGMMPTVAAFLRDMPEGWTGVITTTTHTLAIIDGQSHDNLRTNSRRARVEWAVEMA